MKVWIKAGLVAALSVFSTSSFALVDGQVLVGKRNVDLKTDGETEKASSTSVNLSAHVDPIPLVPVAFGLYLDTNNYDDFKKETGIKARIVLNEITQTGESQSPIPKVSL
jgi:hypothetical protein